VIREAHAHEIALVAAVTVGGESGEILRPLFMTGEAVGDRVAGDEGEEAVVEICRAPAHIDDVVTLLALRRKTRLCVVRLRRRHEVLLVTGHAGNADRRKVQPRITGMAARAIDILVGSDEREPRPLVDLVDVDDKP
jgi:hypothetical protein